jgi:hypothetical protein
MTRRAVAHVAAIGVLAGLAGGCAEVIWIWTYAALTSSDAALVARAVTDAVWFNQNISPVVSGVAIHMGLAAILGVAVALAMRSVAGVQQGIGLYATVSAALIIVWAVNFFIVLPLISPQFVDVVPYAVSLLSKLLFGITAAWTFQLAQLIRSEVLHA